MSWLTLSLSNKILVSEGKHLFIKNIPPYKWKRNDGVRTSPFCNFQWISGSWHLAPTAANITLGDTTEHYVPPDERILHCLGSCQWEQTQGCRASGSSCQFCRKCKEHCIREYIELHHECAIGKSKLWESWWVKWSRFFNRWIVRKRKEWKGGW